MIDLNTLHGLAEFIGATAALAHEWKPFIKSGAKLGEQFLGEPIKIVSAMLGDSMYLRRVQSLAVMLGKTKRIMDAEGIEAKLLPPHFLIPLLEASNAAADDTIHSLFARLLASAVSDDAFQHPQFRHVVSQLNGDEARILAYLLNHDLKIYGILEAVQETYTQNVSDRTIDFSGVTMTQRAMGELYIENLLRLGIIEKPHFLQIVNRVPEGLGLISELVTSRPKVVAKVELTILGCRLAEIAAKELAAPAS